MILFLVISEDLILCLFKVSHKFPLLNHPVAIELTILGAPLTGRVDDKYQWLRSLGLKCVTWQWMDGVWCKSNRWCISLMIDGGTVVGAPRLLCRTIGGSFHCPHRTLRKATIDNGLTLIWKGLALEPLEFGFSQNFNFGYMQMCSFMSICGESVQGLKGFLLVGVWLGQFPNEVSLLTSSCPLAQVRPFWVAIFGQTNAHNLRWRASSSPAGHKWCS